MTAAGKHGLTFSANGITSCAIEFSHETHGPRATGNNWPEGWNRTFMRRGKLHEVWCTRRTVATLLQFNDDGTLAHTVTGTAYCSPKDTYDHEVGRQVALHDLIGNLPKGSGLGQHVIRAYVGRPGALAWVMTPKGTVDYDALRQERNPARIALRKMRALALAAGLASMSRQIAPKATLAIPTVTH